MLRVLLAVLHPGLRDDLMTIIERRGEAQVVTTASDGFEAISLYLRFEPDALILDLGMSHVLPAISTIRSLSSNVVLAVLRNSANEAEIETALTLGATFQIDEGASSQDILAAVGDAVIARTERSDD